MRNPPRSPLHGLRDPGLCWFNANVSRWQRVGEDAPGVDVTLGQVESDTAGPGARGERHNTVHMPRLHTFAATHAAAMPAFTQLVGTQS